MFMELGGSVYITTNKNKTVLYVGVSSELHSRITDHKNRTFPNGFSARYNCDILVYHEPYPTIEEAIAVEKLLKGAVAKRKKNLLMG
jgi:putative endonuclease